MTHDLSLHHRRRPPTREELAGIPWLALLQPEERERAVAALLVGDALSGDYVCRVGRPYNPANPSPLLSPWRQPWHERFRAPIDEPR